MAQPPNFSTLPNDLLWTIFSKIPIANTLSSVCASWKALFTPEKFWKPIFHEMCPKKIQASINKEVSPNFQTTIKSFFALNRENIDFIASLIKDDHQLAKCLHSNDWKLNEFKTLPRFERSRVIWKAIHQDATEILFMLQEAWRPHVCQILNLPPGTNGHVLTPEREKLWQEYFNTEKFSGVISSLIIQNVPCNKVDFICALFIKTQLAGAAFAILTYIVKTHEDLSGLKEKKYVASEAGHLMPIYPEIVDFCLRRYQTTMTREDLILCKLLDENGNYLS